MNTGCRVTTIQKLLGHQRLKPVQGVVGEGLQLVAFGDIDDAGHVAHVVVGVFQLQVHCAVAERASLLQAEGVVAWILGLLAVVEVGGADDPASEAELLHLSQGVVGRTADVQGIALQRQRQALGVVRRGHHLIVRVGRLHHPVHGVVGLLRFVDIAVYLDRVRDHPPAVVVFVQAAVGRIVPDVLTRSRPQLLAIVASPLASSSWWHRSCSRAGGSPVRWEETVSILTARKKLHIIGATDLTPAGLIEM
jgi:hypothetical protein